MPGMSLEISQSDRKPPAKQRLSAKLTAALDNMALQGMRWQDAAIAVDYSTASMWRSLQSNHVQAYLRKQREVFRTSLVDRATFRMIALSEQDDNKAAAVTATAKLMSEVDQEHTNSSHQAMPGLVVRIINSSVSTAVSPAVSTAQPQQPQVIDITAERD